MKNGKNTNYNDLIFTTAKITKEVIIEEDIKVLNKILLEHRKTEQVRTAIAHLLNDYARQKQINEEHKKINAELREKVKKIECENKENKKKYLALLIGQFPNTTETYKKYKKQLEELLQDEDK